MKLNEQDNPWSDSQIEQILSTMQRLEKLTPHSYWLFGSKKHRFKFNETLSEEELENFEHKQGISLPVDYRCFLKNIGNGGAGPSYGLLTLNDAIDGRELNKPFPLTNSNYTMCNEKWDEFLIQIGIVNDDDYDDLPGVMTICHHGCASFSTLVVNGEQYGLMWRGIERFEPYNINFHEWYMTWIYKLENIIILRIESHMKLPSILPGFTRGKVDSICGEISNILETGSITYVEYSNSCVRYEFNNEGILSRMLELF